MMKRNLNIESASSFSWAAIIVITLILLTFSFIVSDSMIVEVHDNLDSVHSWLVVLEQNNMFFSSNAESVPFLGGIDRGYMPSEFQLANILYYFFEPLNAHYINYFLKVVIGTISFYLLGRLVFGENSIFRSVGPIVAFTFALLPGYENLFIAQASVPLIIYLYLRAINAGSSVFFVSAIFYPVLSEFPRYGIFLCGFIFLYSAFLAFQKDKRYRQSFIFLGLLIIGYLITDYRLFYTMLVSGEETIRATMNSSGYPFLSSSLKALVFGQYHAQSLHFAVIAPSLILTFYLFRKQVFNRALIIAGTSRELKVLFICFALVVFNTIIYGLYGISELRSFIGDVIPPLAGFKFSRFIWLNPTLWYLMFSASLILLSRRIGSSLVIALSFLQVLIVIFSPTYSNDFANTLKCSYLSECRSQPTYKDFFSQKLFKRIKNDIDYGGEKVVAFGFHPSVLSYNGFFTLDGYHNSYSKAYKDKFRTIIAPELEKSREFRSYFDNWGGRAYIFSEQVGFQPSTSIEDIQLEVPFSISAARSLEAKYVFSLYEFDISKSDGIEYLGAFTEPEGYYSIYVYQL